MTLCDVRSDWLRGVQLRPVDLMLGGGVFHCAPDALE